MTALATKQDPRPPSEPPPTEPERGNGLLGFGSGHLRVAVGGRRVWVVVGAIMHGTHTLEIGGADQVGIQNWLGDRANDIPLAGPTTGSSRSRRASRTG